MTNTVKLSIEALSASQGNDLITAVDQAATNSIGKVIDITHLSEAALRFTIQTTADKLEQLSYGLSAIGLSLKQEACDVLINASNQYSLYRDIHLNLLVEFF